MFTIAIVNQKGGCGKTTTAINLAGVFAGRGHRTLLVDMDPQSHCAAGLAIPENRIDQHIGDVLLAGVDAPVDSSRLLWRVSRNLDLAPSHLKLAALEASRGELAGQPDAEKRLARVLARFDSQYDICLIDCSPAIGMLAFNALVAADEVLIPVETGFFSLQGATKQVNTIKSIGKRLGVAPVHRVLATMHEPTSVLSKDLLEELRRRFTSRVIPVVIRFDQSLRESASFGQPVVEYAPESNGAKDYCELANWLMTNSLRKDAAARIEIEDEPATPAAPPTAVNGISTAPRMIEPQPVLPANRAADVASRVRKFSAKAAESVTPPQSLPQSLVDAEPNLPTSASMVELKVVEESPHQVPPPEQPAPREPTAPAEYSLTVQATAASEPPLATPPQAAIRTPAPSASVPFRIGFGPQITANGVIFRAPASIGRQAAVAGEFNGWMPERTPMRWNENNGMLEAVAFMPPGSASQYRLVIDGNWIADPYNPSIAPNPYGGTNSVVTMPMMMELVAEVVVPSQHLSRSQA